MTLRVYVAGSSAEPQRVRAAMDAARGAGCELTEDWLAAMEEAGTANEGLTHEQRRRYALADLRGLEAADVLWVLAPETHSIGVWVELGYALAGRAWGAMPGGIVVSGPASARSIFCALADRECPTDAAGLAAVLEATR